MDRSNQQAQGRQINLKVFKQINIGQVVALVIHAMVDLHFDRMASWEVLCFMIWPMLFFHSSQDGHAFLQQSNRDSITSLRVYTPPSSCSPLRYLCYIPHWVGTDLANEQSTRNAPWYPFVLHRQILTTSQLPPYVCTGSLPLQVLHRCTFRNAIFLRIPLRVSLRTPLHLLCFWHQDIVRRRSWQRHRTNIICTLITLLITVSCSWWRRRCRTDIICTLC